MERIDKIRKNAVAYIVTAMLVAIAVLPLFSSCLTIRLMRLSFKESEITLGIGDKYTVTASVLNFEPALAENKNFYLETSNSEIVAITNENTVEAVSAGAAVVTAVSEYDDRIKATLSVNVDYPTPTLLTLSATATVMYVDVMTETQLTVTADCILDPETKFVWKVNGEAVPTDGAPTFSFTPPSKVGEYIVTAELENFDLVATKKIRVFSAPVSKLSAVVETDNAVQSGDYSEVRIKLSYASVAGDPPPERLWFVNGAVYAEDTDVFKFTPQKAGVYDITLKVNGKSVPIGGDDKFTVTARGSIVPQSVSVRYNNIYPNVIIEWVYPHTEKTGYQLKVHNLTTNTVVETYRTTNMSAKPYFDGTTFNAGKVLELDKYSYAISVRSLGDGDVYTPSEYSEPAKTEKLPAQAITYLNLKCMGGTMDYYAVDDEEFCELYAVNMAFRDKNREVKYEVYMGYNSGKTYTALSDEAFAYGATTGTFKTSVSGKGVTRTYKGDIVKVSLTAVSNDLYPTKTGIENRENSVNRQLGAISPHIAPIQTRTANHEFVIDGAAASQKVHSSESLFRTVEYGVRPVPEEGSPAQTLYNYARRLLVRIISDDMSDAEKVHAIYDWIMWNVQYDEASTKVDNPGVYKSYYLEGVLTDTEAFAVCDGMAKTFVLLCNMEGIEAVRVTGRAGDSVAGMSSAEAARYKNENWGGHAWNKVKIDDEWYVVDPTWGDASAMIGGTRSEMALHSWLLVSDSYIADTHEYDNNAHNPATAEEEYGTFVKLLSFEYPKGDTIVRVDGMIETFGKAMNDEIADMMGYLDYLRKTSHAAVTIGNRTQNRIYVGYEIVASPAAAPALAEAARKQTIKDNPFYSALSALGYRSSDYKLLNLNGMIIVLLSVK